MVNPRPFSTRNSSSSSSFSFLSPSSSSSSYVYILESDIDIPTQLLIAKLTLTDLSAHLATLNHDQTRSGPADDELALKQQESELRMWVTCLQDLILARSIDRAVATDRELVRALEVMERSAVEDRRAAEMLQREDRLPGVSEAQRVVGTRNFVIPEVGRDEDDTETVVGSLRPATSATGHTSPSRSGPRLECVSCADRFPQAQCLTAPCNHIYCHGCLVSLVESCVRDETLYPVKCCRQPFPIASLNSLLNVRLRLLFEAKLREYNVPPERRVYCSNPRCSSFLGSATEEGEEPEDIICGSCRTATCASCKQRSHSGSYCPSSVTHSEVALRSLAEQEKWQICPGCRSIVSLTYGCYHITCRCRTEFCYLCAKLWKNCTCPQWEETRLLADAERRVENEIGRAGRIAQPRAFANQVMYRVEELRAGGERAGECDVHEWRNRSGAGRCEECSDWMPVFLKICRHCAMLVCRRCALNRL